MSLLPSKSGMSSATMIPTGGNIVVQGIEIEDVANEERTRVWKTRSAAVIFGLLVIVSWLKFEQYALVSSSSPDTFVRSAAQAFREESEHAPLRPLGRDRRQETRQWAKRYVLRHAKEYRLGHLVRLHAAGFHTVASSIFKKVAAHMLHTKKKRHPSKTAKHSDKAQIRIEAKAAKEIEIARSTAARKYYGFLVYHIMTPVWTFFLLILAAWMGLMLEERTLPAIKAMCTAAQMNDDVAGATVLALATGGFEVLFSAVETLEGEVGVGLNFVLGSGIVNFGLILPVVSLASTTPIIELEFGPVLRDGGFALLAFFALLFVVSDGNVSMTESFGLLLLYALHVLACLNSPNLFYSTTSPIKQAEVNSTDNRILITPSLAQDESLVVPAPSHSTLDQSSQCLSRPAQNTQLSTMRREPSWLNELYIDVQSPPAEQSLTWTSMLTKSVRQAADHPFARSALTMARKVLPPVPRGIRLVHGERTGNEMLFSPRDAARLSTVAFAVAPTLLVSAAWLICLLLLLTRLADLLALSARLPLGFAASVFLPAIYAVPDVLVSAAVARRGQARAAVANALGVQVVTVLLGVGLPFFLATARANGRPVAVLGSQSDVSLRWSVFALGSLFVALVLLPPLPRTLHFIWNRCLRPSLTLFTTNPCRPYPLLGNNSDSPTSQSCQFTPPCFTPRSAVFLFCAYLLVTVFVTIRTV